MSLLSDAIFSSVALGHLIVDVLNGQRSILLTYWSSQLGLTNTTLAGISTIYVWAASLSQPVFGWLADRFGRTRLFAAGGILWMGAFFGLALYLPVEMAVPCLILASLGSAAFHPVGTMQATLQGKSRMERRETTAAAWFFLFGQFGYFMGPIAGGPLLQLFGPTGLLVLTAPALLIGLNAAWQLRAIPKQPAQRVEDPPGPAEVKRSVRPMVLALALVAALQAWAQQNMNTFLPKYLSDMGQTAAVYGLLTGLFMGGSAFGNVLGGSLADRFGKQRIAQVALGLAALPLYLIARVGWSPWLYLLVPLSGALTGAVHSIVVVLAQQRLRGGMALTSGLTLGFMFSAGALGTLVSGPMADRWGFQPVFQMTAGLVLLASFLTLGLREPPGR
jgi:FSR family fosmidomycin resistance protein-like MFS transporter